VRWLEIQTAFQEGVPSEDISLPPAQLLMLFASPHPRQYSQNFSMIQVQDHPVQLGDERQDAEANGKECEAAEKTTDRTSQKKKKKTKKKKNVPRISDPNAVYIPPIYRNNLRIVASPRPGVGRCAVAVKSLAPGELIFEEEPVALLNFSRYASEYCVFCGKFAAAGSGRLTSVRDVFIDGPTYCCADGACTNRGSAHRLAGKSVWTRVAEIAKEEKADVYLLSMVVLLLCQWHLARGQGMGEDAGELAEVTEGIGRERCLQWRDVEKLTDHWEEQKEEWKQCVAKAMRRLLKHFPEQMRCRGSDGEEGEEAGVEDAVRLACLVNVNSHGIGSGRSFNHMRGMGIFPLLACLNHSCRPNCAYVFDSETGKMCLRALDGIPAGAELCVHYTNLLVPRDVRQKELQETKHFLCACSRCQGEGEGEDADALLGTLCCAECGLEGRVVAGPASPVQGAHDAAAAALLLAEEEEIERTEGKKAKKKKKKKEKKDLGEEGSSQKEVEGEGVAEERLASLTMEPKAPEEPRSGVKTGTESGEGLDSEGGLASPAGATAQNEAIAEETDEEAARRCIKCGATFTTKEVDAYLERVEIGTVQGQLLVRGQTLGAAKQHLDDMMLLHTATATREGRKEGGGARGTPSRLRLHPRHYLLIEPVAMLINLNVKMKEYAGKEGAGCKRTGCSR